MPGRKNLVHRATWFHPMNCNKVELRVPFNEPPGGGGEINNYYNHTVMKFKIYART